MGQYLALFYCLPASRKKHGAGIDQSSALLPGGGHEYIEQECAEESNLPFPPSKNRYLFLGMLSLTAFALSVDKKTKTNTKLIVLYVLPFFKKIVFFLHN
jgi:hypothetical protein